MPLDPLDAYVATQTRALLRSVLRWSAGVVVWLGVVYLVAPPIRPGGPFAASCFATAIAALLLDRIGHAVRLEWVGVTAFAAACAAQLLGFAFVGFSGDLAQTVVLVITMLGAAYGLPDARWAILLSGLTFGAWVGFAIGHPAAAITHWGVNLVTTSVLTVLITAARVRALRRQGQTEIELRAASRAARAAGDAKSEFLATMSHEIRTPLHGIFGMTELALDTDDDADRRDFLRRARACAATLLAIVDDVLDFARIEARTLRLVPLDFDLRATVDGVLDPLRLQARERGLALEIAIDPALPRTLHGDAGRVGQIVVNLVANAIKFTERGRVSLRLVRIDGGPPGTVTVRGDVEDTGIGIDPALHAHVFESFTQADGSMTRRHDGAGLGLAITRALVQAMDGTIVVASAPGAGSTFTFEIRLALAAPTSIAADVAA